MDNKLRWWHSPYTVREKLDFLKYRITHPRRTSCEAMQSPLPYGVVSISEGEPDFRLLFVGDMMPVGSRDLRLSEELQALVQSADSTVVNLEGVLTERRRLLALSHRPEVVRTLRELFGDSVVVNIANNHAADFGRIPLESEVERLRQEGFEVVGHLQQPGLLLAQGIYLEGATAWSNQPMEVVPSFSLSEVKHPPEGIVGRAYTIFMPHWGYEMHLHPSLRQIHYAHELIEAGWQAVVGHHPHCPQPIEQIDSDGLVAYSLGNFCNCNHNPNHKRGLVLALDFRLSCMPQTPPTLVRVESHVVSHTVCQDAVCLSLQQRLDYREERRRIRRWSPRYLGDILK